MRRTEFSLKTERFDNFLQQLSSTPAFGRTCSNQGLRVQIPFQEHVGRSSPPAQRQRGYLLCKDSRTEGVRLGDGVQDWRWSSTQKPLAQFPFEVWQSQVGAKAASAWVGEAAGSDGLISSAGNAHSVRGEGEMGFSDPSPVF